MSDHWPDPPPESWKRLDDVLREQVERLAQRRALRDRVPAKLVDELDDDDVAWVTRWSRRSTSSEKSAMPAPSEFETIREQLAVALEAVLHSAPDHPAAPGIAVQLMLEAIRPGCDGATPEDKATVAGWLRRLADNLDPPA